MQVYTYGHNQPPVYVKTQGEGPGSSVEAQLAALVANEAGNKCMLNAARMLCYNLLVGNGWNNPFYQEVVQFAADLTNLKYRKNVIRTPEENIQSTVAEVLGFFTSRLVFDFPELQNMVDGRMLSAANQNVPIFNNLKAEIEQMYSSHPGQPGQQHFVQDQYGRMVPVAPQGHMVHHGHPSPGHHVPYGQPGHYGHGGGGGVVMARPAGASHGGGGVYGGHQQQPTHDVTQYQGGGSGWGRRGFDGQQETAVDSVATSRFAARPQQQRQQHRHEEQPQTIMGQPVARQEAPKVQVAPKQTTLEILGGNEMDREKHTITYFGGSFSTTPVRQSQRMEKAAASLDEATLDNQPVTDVTLYPKVGLELDLETAIASGRANQHESQGKSSYRKVFRYFSIVANMFTTQEQLSQIFPVMYEPSSFEQLVTAIKNAAERYVKLPDEPAKFDGDERMMITSPTDFEEAVANDPNAEAMIQEHQRAGNEALRHSNLAFLTFLDNTLTDLVNDFLKHRIGVTARIGSFTEDISDLRSYLLNKNGHSHARALDKFEKEVMESVFMASDRGGARGTLTEGVRQIMNDLGYDDRKSQGLAVPITYSITYLCMDSKQLGFKLSDEPVIIDVATAPVLYKICRSLAAHRSELLSETMYDILVTTDGVRYRFISNYLDSREYSIVRHN
jgi:hypothetical protein